MSAVATKGRKVTCTNNNSKKSTSFTVEAVNGSNAAAPATATETKPVAAAPAAVESAAANTKGKEKAAVQALVDQIISAAATTTTKEAIPAFNELLNQYNNALKTVMSDEKAIAAAVTPIDITLEDVGAIKVPVDTAVGKVKSLTMEGGRRKTHRKKHGKRSKTHKKHGKKHHGKHHKKHSMKRHGKHGKRSRKH